MQQEGDNSELMKRVEQRNLAHAILKKWESSVKYVTISNVVTTDKGFLATHNGYFHCDEVLAAAMLNVLSEYAEIPIVRTRNPEILKQAHLIFDVGGVYDPDTFRFDHHQESFTETFEDDSKIKLSSAGLIYYHYGGRILLELTRDLYTITPENIFTLINRVYHGFIKHIDGIDNGVPAVEGGVKNYSIPTSLSSRVSRINPASRDKDINENEQFRKAMLMVGTEFIQYVHEQVMDWLPDREVVEAGWKKRMDIHPSGKIVLVESSCMFKDHIYDLEREDKVENHTLYVVHQARNGAWQTTCLNVKGEQFASRKPLPFGGKIVAELVEMTGIPDITFVHVSGFTGGAATKEGAIKLALFALNF
jgi:uncharacterized UPF0160 family protein